MQQDVVARALEHDQLLKLNRKVTAITGFLVSPLVVLNLGYQAWISGAWQFWAVTAVMIVTGLCWMSAHLLTRRGSLVGSAALMMYASLVFDACAMGLRQDTLATAALADVCMIVYGSVFAPRLAIGGSIFSILSLSALRVLGFYGRLPVAEPTPHLAMMLDLSIILCAIPVTVYFLQARARINELPHQVLSESAAQQRDLIEAVTRLQPQVRELVGQSEGTTRVLASQARQQVATAEDVGRAMRDLQQVLSEAAASAHASRDNAEATKVEATKGTEQLAEASQQLELFRDVAGGIQASMRQLSEQSQRTDEVISLIREIDAQLNVLAINAALEAARSGEVGKGFEVVAKELRGLLRRSVESLAHGSALLGGIRKEASLTLERTESAIAQLGQHLASLGEARTTIERISSSFVASAEKAGAVADSADRQQDRFSSVFNAMAQLQQSAGGLERSAKALSESMRRLSEGQQEVGALLERNQLAAAEAATAERAQDTSEKLE